MDRFAIIVAGGNGSRMGAQIPKQFLALKGVPILVHTIKKFLTTENTTIILVLPKEEHQRWDEIKSIYFSDHTIRTVVGGETRYHSVKNALNSIQQANGLVTIHDAVRPLIPTDIIEQSFLDAATFHSAVVAIPLKDSIRQCQGTQNKALPRDQFKLIQTPQTFDLKKLKEAYNTSYNPNFTDDASVFEAAGHKIHLIEGSYQNIKITTPEDLLIANSLLTD